MTDLLIRNVEQGAYDWLKAQAAEHGRSLSEEAKVVLVRELHLRTDIRRRRNAEQGQRDD